MKFLQSSIWILIFWEIFSFRPILILGLTLDCTKDLARPYQTLSALTRPCQPLFDLAWPCQTMVDLGRPCLLPALATLCCILTQHWIGHENLPKMNIHMQFLIHKINWVVFFHISIHKTYQKQSLTYLKTLFILQGYSIQISRGSET